MALTIGSYIWLPCEVKPGPFSDERLVRVKSALSDWLGFVPTSSLKEPISEGRTQVTAVIVELRNDRLRAQVSGVPVANSLIEDEISRAREA
jgi:hypothetical protein